MRDLVTYNLQKALLILAYVDKTYENHVIMFRGSDAPISHSRWLIPVKAIPYWVPKQQDTHEFRQKSALVT